MSVSLESSGSELSLPEEEEGEQFNLGLYIGERNAACERHGRGWAILPNGDQYDGQYRQGRRHGIGLYVFKNGSRYYGHYRCGRRSGRGMFIYPDGSMYEGNWRRNIKHGKGRYNYGNGDNYTGDWYHGQRHGVGIYTMSSGVCQIRFKGTWHHGVRAGPFEVYFGGEDHSIVLHGSWDKDYPQGPAVFSFDQRYMLMGFFQSPGEPRAGGGSQHDEEGGGDYVGEDQLRESVEMEPFQPSLWYAQDICAYDYSQLPQEPVPLPLSDSDISVCSLSTVPTEPSAEKSFTDMGEGEEDEGGAEECVPCECECTLSEDETETESEPCLPTADPCDIEIKKDPIC